MTRSVRTVRPQNWDNPPARRARGSARSEPVDLRARLAGAPATAPPAAPSAPAPGRVAPALPGPPRAPRALPAPAGTNRTVATHEEAPRRGYREARVPASRAARPGASFVALLLVLIGAAGLAIGAGQPWIVGRQDIVNVSPTGLDSGAGWWLVGCALALGLTGVFAWQLRRIWYVPLAVTLLIAGFAGVKFHATVNEIGRLHNAGGVASVGAGWWIIAAALAVAIVGSFQMRGPNT